MRKLNYPAIAERIIRDLREYFADAGFSKAVIGLSGGIDSAVSYVLAVKALGADAVMALMLPNGGNASSENSIKHAQELINKFGGKGQIIDISEAVATMYKWFGSNDNNVRKGNIAARTRMIVLFDYSAKEKCLVVGTENKSEHCLGYFTLFGDSASCIEPIRHLYKTEIFEFAKYLGVTETIINKAPSAELWEGQTDEGEFGFTYAEADAYIERLEGDGPGNKMEIAAIDTVINARITAMRFKRNVPYVVPDFTNL